MVACIFIFPAVSSAASGNNFKVWVGYFGGPYYEKASYTHDELEGIMEDTNGGELIEYSSMDKTGFLRKGFACGIYLVDLLDIVGIDRSAVTQLYFDTDDSYRADDEANPVRQWSYKNLLGTTRYYYPNLYQYYDYLDSKIPSKNLAKIERSKTQVEPVLALESSFQKIGGNAQTQEDGLKAAEAVWNDTSQMTSTLGNRIMFGQTSPDDHTAGYSAHSIKSLKVTYAGHPSIVLSRSDISGKVGETITVKARIDAADSLISSEGLDDLNWKISDESVAKIVSVKNGEVKIKILSEGDASLSVSYGEDGLDGATSSVAGISGSKAAKKKDDDSGKGSGGGSGGGSGSGSGEGSGSGTGESTGAGGTSSGSESNIDSGKTTGLSGLDNAVQITAGSNAGGGEEGKAVEVAEVDENDAEAFKSAYELNPVIVDETLETITGYAAEAVAAGSLLIIVAGAVGHTLTRRARSGVLQVERNDAVASAAA